MSETSPNAKNCLVVDTLVEVLHDQDHTDITINHQEHNQPENTTHNKHRNKSNGGEKSQIANNHNVRNKLLASQQNNTKNTGMNKSKGNQSRNQSTGTLELSGLLQNIQMSRRLLGEIAFQLDRRIINHVFCQSHDKRERKRLYGYSVQNIPSMIKRHAIDHSTGQVRKLTF